MKASVQATQSTSSARSSCPRALLGIASLLAASLGGEASAECNVIPAATKDFRAAIGSANRPFASPGEYVEARVRPRVCDRGSTGYVDLDGDGRVADDYVVTVLFVPPAPGAANAVVLAEDCGSVALGTCSISGAVECVQVNGAGEPPGTLVPSARELQFRFPDTDALQAPAGDRKPLAGPAKIVVTRARAPLRCGFVSQRCPTAPARPPPTGSWPASTSFSSSMAPATPIHRS